MPWLNSITHWFDRAKWRRVYVPWLIDMTYKPITCVHVPWLIDMTHWHDSLTWLIDMTHWHDSLTWLMDMTGHNGGRMGALCVLWSLCGPLGLGGWPPKSGMCEWVMAHMLMSHCTHVDESWHTCWWVMSHIWIRHDPHMNESCHDVCFISLSLGFGRWLIWGGLS